MTSAREKGAAMRITIDLERREASALLRVLRRMLPEHVEGAERAEVNEWDDLSSTHHGIMRPGCYSITSSAPASNEGGTVRPSVSAVLR
jgi:hypothetical protein